MTRTYTEITGDGGSNVLEQVVAQLESLEDRMRNVKRVIALMSGKGGVGKSTLTANLAAAIADRGWRVGALDADLEASTLAKMLGASGQDLGLRHDGVEPAVGIAGVKVMSMDLFLDSDETALTWQHLEGLAEDSFVWRGVMETTTLREFLADTIWGELDFLLVDLPPDTQHFSTITRWIPTATGLTVTIPSAVSHLVVKKSINAVKAAGGRLIGLIENMSGYVCPECSTLSPLFDADPRSEHEAESLGLPFLGSIPFDPRMTHGCDEGLPFVLSHPDTLAAQALTKVVETLITLV